MKTFFLTLITFTFLFIAPVFSQTTVDNFAIDNAEYHYQFSDLVDQ